MIFSDFYYMLYLNIYFYLALYLPHEEPTESSKTEGREREENIPTNLGKQNLKCETGLNGSGQL